MRNLLVHLDSSATTSGRLALAVKIAARHKARLVGLFAQTGKTHLVGLVGQWPPEDYVRAAKESEAAFAAAAAGLAEKAWVDLNRGAESEILEQICDYARHFDLVVCGQPQPDHPPAPADLIERIVVDSGRPVLAVPYAGQFEDIGRRPLFAWSDSREAARAMADAIDLVAPGADALVVSVEKQGDEAKRAYRRKSLDLAIEHLATHGIKARADQATVTDIGLMDALLNEAVDHSADLLAIGAFGGQGYPRFSRGSGSRFMLKHMTLPVLLSH